MLASGDDEGKHDVLAGDSGWLHQLVACLFVAKGVAVMAATLVYGSALKSKSQCGAKSQWLDWQ
jgi:hypothetical protein